MRTFFHNIIQTGNKRRICEESSHTCCSVSNTVQFLAVPWLNKAVNPGKKEHPGLGSIMFQFNIQTFCAHFKLLWLLKNPTLSVNCDFIPSYFLSLSSEAFFLIMKSFNHFPLCFHLHVQCCLKSSPLTFTR